MTTTIQQARFTGVLYLIIIVSGIFGGMIGREGLIAIGDPTTTASNILASESLFRGGFIADLIMTVADVAVALMFYILLKPVSKPLALMAAFFRLTQASIMGLNLLNHFMALVVLKSNSLLGSFNTDQLNEMSMLFLNAHSYGYLISNVFFGFSCAILAYLFYKSDIFPKFLGIMVALASLGYLMNCYMKFMMPEIAGISDDFLLVSAVPTELTLCLYLLIKGVKRK